MTARLKIIARAVEIRVERGEDMNQVLNSYKNLTDSDKKEIQEYLASK